MVGKRAHRVPWPELGEELCSIPPSKKSYALSSGSCSRSKGCMSKWLSNASTSWLSEILHHGRPFTHDNC